TGHACRTVGEGAEDVGEAAYPAWPHAIRGSVGRDLGGECVGGRRIGFLGELDREGSNSTRKRRSGGWIDFQSSPRSYERSRDKHGAEQAQDGDGGIPSC